MSAHYRNQITLSCNEANEILNNQKHFPVPARPAGQSDAVYAARVKAIIQANDDEVSDVNVFVNDITSSCDRWMSLRTNMTGAERTADNPIYDNFANDVPFQQVLSNLRRYLRALRDEHRILEDALPVEPPQPVQNPVPVQPHHPVAPPAPVPSLVHLPKTTLPSFSGSCAEYISFWNSFKAGVHDLPTLSPSIKFTYLKQCLSGPPLTLINSLPVTDASYQTALDLLKTNYGNEEDVARALHQSLRKLPRVRSGETFSSDLRTLVDQIESICVQMSQQNQDYNTIAVQMEIEERLPRFVLTEIFKAKEDFLEREAEEPDPEEWSTDQLKLRLRTILKRQDHIESLSAKDHSNNNAKKPSSSAQHSSPQQPQSSQLSSLTFHTQNDGSKPKTQSSQSKIPPKPQLPCLFCAKEGHFSTNCDQFPDVNSRTSRLRTLKRCFKCLKTDHFANKCSSPSRCSNCLGMHPRPLCPTKRGQKPNNQTQSTHFSQTQSNTSPPLVPPISSAASFYPNTPLPTFNPHFYPHLYQIPAVPSLPNSPLPPTQSIVTSQNEKPPNQTNTSTLGQNPNRFPVLLKCVRVQFFNPNDPTQFRQGILLLDDASTNSYITISEANALNLSLTPAPINVGVFACPNSRTLPSFSTTFGIRLIDGRSLLVTANAVSHLTQPTHHLPLTPQLLAHTEIFPPSETVQPVILLGSDYYYDVEPIPIMRLPSGYRLIQTLLGPIVAGKAYSSMASLSIQSTNVSIQDPPIVPPHDFFSLESIGIIDSDDPPSSNDLVLQNFNSEIEFVDGRYQIKFPFKSNPSSLPLPTNFGLSWGRLRSVLNSLSKTPSLLSKYDAIIKEQLHLGIIELVDNNSPQSIPPPLHYLPHHPVINEIKNKVRIVYDGSAQIGKELSINDCLHPGPVILPELVGLLLRFRLPNIAVACDIEKAFLQVSVHPSHRNCIRFLWVKNPNLPLSQSNMQIYRFARVPFGLAPSPFLLAGTIQYHLSQFPSLLSTEIANNMYVDNILLSAQNPSEAKEKCAATISLFSKAKMSVREFVSNSPLALSQLKDEEKLAGIFQKFLGISWNTSSDTLIFEICPPPSTFVPSKRTILAFVSSHFDPLGLISPVLLPLKSFLQALWREDLKWDENLSPALYDQWAKIMEEWSPQTVTLPRHLSTFPSSQGLYQLHCFSDASGFAMCATVYLRVLLPYSTSAVCPLIFSKTKVKPVDKKGSQNLTIPRLELIAAMMGARALKFVHSHLTELPLDSSLNLWSDSSAVIAWLNSTAPLREIFVQNRVQSIRSTPNLIVRHIPGSENPADIGSRGTPSLNSLKNLAYWWNGPDWLRFSSECWPSPNPEIKNFSSNEYQTKTGPSSPIFTCHVEQIHVPNPMLDPKKFSRLPKLLRVVSYFTRAIFRVNPTYFPPSFPQKFCTPSISPIEIRFTLQFLIKKEQTRFPPLDRDNEGLGLFLDPNQILRSKGRLGKSRLPPDTKEPIYLPPQSHLTQLIIHETHLINHHSSPLLTLSLIRRQFWIPKGRKVVEKAISKMCLPCRRFTSRPFDLPSYPSFPIDRVKPSPPFSTVGLDFCGPLYVQPRQPHKKPRKNATEQTEKVWIVLWVCLATRGVSLDLVADQSSPSFILAFRRFCAKFGAPKSVYSDNAPTFVHFSKTILPHPPINWFFRAPYAPWKGGHYERLVSLIKFHLRRSLSPSGFKPYFLHFDHISTILAEIETIINSRPISYDSANPMDPRPLRPIDFIRPMGHQIGLNFPSLNDDPKDPDFIPNSNSCSLTLLWDQLTKTTHKFWERWGYEYLLSLRERYKKLSPKNNRRPQVGELVLVYSETLPRSLWTLALVQQVYLNENNIPDTAQIKFPSGYITTRSVFRLYPLETRDELQSRDPAVTTSDVHTPLSHTIPTTSVPTSTTPDNNYIQLRNRNIPRF